MKERICALCGRRIPPGETATFSRFTRSYFCTGKQEAACKQRRQKKEKSGGSPNP